MKKMVQGLMRVLDITRRLILNALFIGAIMVLIAAYMMDEKKLPEQGVLVLNPQGAVVEELKRPDASSWTLPDTNQAVLPDILRALKQAKDDEHIVAVRLDLEAMGRTSLAKLQSLRHAIEDFKRSGKPILASGYSYTQGQYYVAATADTVFLHPMGNIELKGFSVYRNYIHQALDKLHVDVHVFRVGEFKSAVEPLIRDSMSAAAKQSNRQWLDELWSEYKRDVADMRGMSAEHIQAVADDPAKFLHQYAGDSAAFFVQDKWVDRLGDARDARAFLQQKVGWTSSEALPEVDYKDYLHQYAGNEREHHTANIGLIVASGTIVGGQQPAGTIGSDTLSDLLQQAEDDDAIQAVVLRVDSPGGSALASEVIRQAVMRVQAAGKPVVVSMGSMAASGGYWISAGADAIVAQSSTLTGSIGVFGMIPDVSRALESLGIHGDGVGTTRMAGSMRMDRALSQEQSALIQMNVEHTYQSFIQRVAQGRHLDEAKVRVIAEGRVWSGVDAKRLGLVDRLGDLPDAIALAAQRAGIAKDYGVQRIQSSVTWQDMLAESVLGDVMMHSLMQQHLFQTMAWWQLSAVQHVLQPLAKLLQLQDPRFVYAYEADAGLI